MHPRGAKHHIRLQILQIPRSQPELQSLLLQVQDLPVQLLPVRPVAARNPAPGFQQQPGQGPVADPQPQNQQPLLPPFGQKRLQFPIRHTIPQFRAQSAILPT